MSDAVLQSGFNLLESFFLLQGYFEMLTRIDHFLRLNKHYRISTLFRLPSGIVNSSIDLKESALSFHSA